MMTHPGTLLTPAERLRQLQEQKTAVHHVFAKLDHALAERRITLPEYRAYINQYYHGMLEHEFLRSLEAEEQSIRSTITAEKQGRHHSLSVAMGIVLVALVLSIGSLLFTSTSGPIAHVVYNPQQHAEPVGIFLNQSTNLSLNISNTTTLKVTGTLAGGSADLALFRDDVRLVLYRGDATQRSIITTAKESYALNESITALVTPIDGSFTLWLTDETGEKTLVKTAFFPAAPGAYKLDALINESDNITKASVEFIVRDDTDTEKDVLRVVSPNVVAFTESCIDTCELADTGEGPLRLEAILAPETTLTITNLIITKAVHSVPPVQVAPIPDLTVLEGEVVTLNISLYFTDADSDVLLYDVLQPMGATLAIEGELLKVTGVAAGSSKSKIYASDLSSIAQSNEFMIMVLPGAATNETITTTNMTENMTTNTTTNTTTNGTTVGEEVAENTMTTNITDSQNENNATNMSTSILTASDAIDCSDPDPNRRALECIQAADSSWFKQEMLLLENKRGVAVGQLTPVGNLLLRGTVVERSVGEPAADDYQIGSVDGNGDFIATIWIDAASGDLHLRGSLTEVNGNIVYTEGKTALTNQRGIILALADRGTGDLAVRGNVVPYRRTIG